jgi:hypothetical protein
MSKTVILRGTATVSFVKIIREVEEDEAETLQTDADLQEGQIFFEDCQELIGIERIEVEVR